MKRITIAQKLRPFSHTPGATFVLPHTTWAVKVFPVRLEFVDLEGRGEPFIWELDIQGPIAGFTAQLDLERGRVHVFGKEMRYTLYPKEEGIWLKMGNQEEKRLFSCKTQVRLAAERLSLGMHKAQDWDLIKRRLDYKEIFPFWLLLGHQVESSCTEEFPLLKECARLIENRDKLAILKAFEALFLTGFKGVLTPRGFDEDYQGMIKESLPTHSLAPLIQGARLIRSLFVQCHDKQIELLPCLPPMFHCGRFVHMALGEGVTLDMEWSKKTLKKVAIRTTRETEITLQFPKKIGSFRLNRKTRIHLDADHKTCLSMTKSQDFWLDQFMH